MDFYSFYFQFPQSRKIPDDKMPMESPKTKKHRSRTDQNSSHKNFQVEINNSPAVSFFGNNNFFNSAHDSRITSSTTFSARSGLTLTAKNDGRPFSRVNFRFLLSFFAQFLILAWFAANFCPDGIFSNFQNLGFARTKTQRVEIMKYGMSKSPQALSTIQVHDPGKGCHFSGTTIPVSIRQALPAAHNMMFFVLDIDSVNGMADEAQNLIDYCWINPAQQYMNLALIRFEHSGVSSLQGPDLGNKMTDSVVQHIATSQWINYPHRCKYSGLIQCGTGFTPVLLRFVDIMAPICFNSQMSLFDDESIDLGVRQFVTVLLKFPNPRCVTFEVFQSGTTLTPTPPKEGLWRKRRMTTPPDPDLKLFLLYPPTQCIMRNLVFTFPDLDLKKWRADSNAQHLVAGHLISSAQQCMNLGSSNFKVLSLDGEFVDFGGWRFVSVPLNSPVQQCATCGRHHSGSTTTPTSSTEDPLRNLTAFTLSNTNFELFLRNPLYQRDSYLHPVSTTSDPEPGSSKGLSGTPVGANHDSPPPPTNIEFVDFRRQQLAPSLAHHPTHRLVADNESVDPRNQRLINFFMWGGSRGYLDSPPKRVALRDSTATITVAKQRSCQSQRSVICSRS
jgi:hypothetical protein